jgi:hypothetical protein
MLWRIPAGKRTGSYFFQSLTITSSSPPAFQYNYFGHDEWRLRRIWWTLRSTRVSRCSRQRVADRQAQLPSLPSHALPGGDRLAIGQISGPLRSILSRQANVEVLMDEVSGVDTDKRLVRLKQHKSEFTFIRALNDELRSWDTSSDILWNQLESAVFYGLIHYRNSRWFPVYVSRQKRQVT